MDYFGQNNVHISLLEQFWGIMDRRLKILADPPKLAALDGAVQVAWNDTTQGEIDLCNWVYDRTY